MNIKLSRIFSGILIVLILIYYASITMFVHTHHEGFQTITHSHPFSSKSHTHSNNEYRLIHYLTVTAQIIATAAFFLFSPKTEIVVKWICQKEVHRKPALIAAIDVRGPPHK